MAGSTFGTIGPDAHREGADLAAQAAGGLISTTGRPGGEPTPVGATVAGHTVTYLADASASHALDDIAANDVHRVVSGLAGLYGDVITTRTWIARTSEAGSAIVAATDRRSRSGVYDRRKTNPSSCRFLRR